MMTVDGLLASCRSVQKEIDGQWVPCRPLPCEPFLWRLKDAWEVLRRRADAVTWPGGQ